MKRNLKIKPAGALASQTQSLRRRTGNMKAAALHRRGE